MKLSRARILAEGWLSTEGLRRELASRGVEMSLRTIRRYHELRLIQGAFGPPEDVSSNAKYRLYYPSATIRKVRAIRRKMQRGYRLEELARKEMTPERAIASLVEWRSRSTKGFEKLTALLAEEGKRTGLPLADALAALMGNGSQTGSRSGKQLYIEYE